MEEMMRVILRMVVKNGYRQTLLDACGVERLVWSVCEP